MDVKETPIFFIVKQQSSRVPTRCEASWKGGIVIAKQQGSWVPNRCEASWKGGVLIYLTIILYIIFLFILQYSSRFLTFLFQKYLQNHIQVFLTLKLINFYFLLRYLQEYRLLLYIFCHFSLLF